MKNSAILKYDNQVPRYTSYPTAPNFTPKITGEIYVDWLKNLPSSKNLSLYFHIPFCKQLCWYCGCYTKATQRYEPIEDYVHILTSEIKIIGDLLNEKKHQISHIHFGGGSPTILHENSFQHLINSIKNNFNLTKNVEIAIEVDPRNLSENDIKNYALCGVNRVSIGAQDFNPEVQIAINREQSFDLIHDCINLFRQLKSII